MKRFKIILIALLGGSALSFAPNGHTGELRQTENAAAIDWLSWEEAMALSKKDKKKILLAVYTDWCGWCKRMESATFEQPALAGYINERFYAVKFDAEQKQELEYKGKSYKLLKTTGRRNYHELAAELLRGQMSFPSMVFLDENQDHIQTIVGFKTPQQFEKIATYFAEDHYKETPWSAYEKGYQLILVKEE